jgi:hypothetical protein
MRLSVALLLVLAPVTAACGSATPGASGGNEVIATPASPSPSPAVPNCGLNPSGEAARNNDGLRFPATTEYVGKTLEEVQTMATARALTVRVVGRDGECMAVTDDMRADRVNVYVEGGRVTAVGAY